MVSKMQKINLSNRYYSKVSENIKLKARVFPERIPAILRQERIAYKKSTIIKEQLFHLSNIKYLESLNV